MSAQFGEISGRNNAAQENVSDFTSPGGSPCDPVFIRSAVRNPVDTRHLVHVALHGIPRGWMAQLPHAWVWLDGRAEKEIDVAIWPTADVNDYKIGSGPTEHDERDLPGTAPVRVSGASGEAAASRFYPIGGAFYRVHVRRKSSIKIDVGRSDREEFAWTVFGVADPAVADQRVVIDVTAPIGKDVTSLVAFTAPTDGCKPHST